MRLKYSIAALLTLFLFTGTVQAQSQAKIPRVLFLLDGSSSMNEDWTKDHSRLKEAGHFILGLIDSMSRVDPSVEFGLRVFGHQYPSQQRNCYDTKMEVRFSQGHTGQMQLRLESLHGYGVSPIAYSLSEAAIEDFSEENKYAYSIVLVTDGGESCDGNICKVAQDLLARKIFFRPYIVSLVDYAPLRQIYSCLGSFLIVGKESEEPVAIKKIVDAHREGFERAKTGKTIPVIYQDTTTVVTEKPAKPKDTPVLVKATPVKPKDTPVIVKEVKTPVKPKDTVARVPLPQPRKKIVIPRLEIASLKEYAAGDMEIFYPEKINVPAPVYSKAPPVAPVVVQPLPPRPPEKLFAPLKPAGRKKYISSLNVPPNPRKLNVPPYQLVSSVPPKTDTMAKTPAPEAVKKKIPVAEATNPGKKTNPYVIEKTPSPETLLEVYFTDGNGKFYSTSPQILLTDDAGKELKKFYRTVGPNGDPDPQRILAGTYNLSVAGSDKTFLKGIVVSPETKTKVIITVTDGSLKFSYDKNVKKPVDKYYAIVKRNFEPLPVVRQRCDTMLPYPPGNYHIEINTLPPTSFSVDLSFGVTVMLPVAEPGTLLFTNTDNLGKIRLFYPLGDKFVQFYTMNIAGDLSVQKVELKPGIYQVYYALGPGLPEKVLTFHVRSNETVSIELK